MAEILESLPSLHETDLYPDCEVKEGETVFLLGPSGSGKSTLLRLLNGSISPSAGKVFYNGRDLLEYKPLQVRREVVLAGQSAFLFPGTVRENFQQYYEYRESPPPDDESIKKCLDICMAPFLPDDSCNNLSGGEKQRIFLAVALSFRPSVFLLDEPTSALDRETAEGFMKNVTDHCHKRGIASVIVSHDRHLIDMFADRTINVGGTAE